MTRVDLAQSLAVGLSWFFWCVDCMQQLDSVTDEISSQLVFMGLQLGKILHAFRELYSRQCPDVIAAAWGRFPSFQRYSIAIC